MKDNQTLWNEFKANLEKLTSTPAPPGGVLDAFELEKLRPVRQDNAIHPGNTPEWEKFEKEWVNTLIMQDAARQMLVLVNTLMTKFMPLI